MYWDAKAKMHVIQWNDGSGWIAVCASDLNGKCFRHDGINPKITIFEQII